MIIRSVGELADTEYEVQWGNGVSTRLLTAKDNMGFTVCRTVVRAGTSSLLQYRSHLEACYCIDGSGEIEDLSGNIHRITPGVLYALDDHDPHHLRADAHGDLILLSVFNPPLQGYERHSLESSEASSY